MSYWRKKTPFDVNIYSVVSHLRMAYYCLYKNMAASYKLLGLDIEGLMDGGHRFGGFLGVHVSKNLTSLWWEPQDIVNILGGDLMTDGKKGTSDITAQDPHYTDGETEAWEI